MLQNLISNGEAMNRCERGSVAIMFGVSFTVLCLMTGLAFDVGRAFSSKSKVSEAADAAALAAAKGIRLEGLTDDQAITLAKQVFTANIQYGSGRWTDVHSIDVVIDRNTMTARVDVNSSVKTTFASLAGIAAIGAPATASAIFESKDVEVGVQLDMTGSMSGTKIQDLKAATANLVNILLPSTPTGQKVRVGFAPFSAGVNVGTYVQAVNGNRPSANTCVYERLSNANEVTDNAPVGQDAFKIKSDLSAPQHLIQNCPNAQIVPLTDDRDVLLGKIPTFAATGSTAGQLGAAWAWNLVSPKWSSIWPSASQPAAYGPDTDKFVILMTDGVYNTIGGVMNGGNAQPASDLSVAICNQMKNQGITVYTVGFDLDSIWPMSDRTRATDTLKACAGKKGHPNPEQFFYQADDGAALSSAFSSIATAIMRLRLSN